MVYVRQSEGNTSPSHSMTFDGQGFVYAMQSNNLGKSIYLKNNASVEPSAIEHCGNTKAQPQWTEPNVG